MKCHLVLIILTLFFVQAAHTEDKFRFFDIDPSPKFWGAATDFDLGFRFFDDLDTVLWGRAHIAYDNIGYFLDPQLQTLNSNLADEATVLSEQALFYAWNLKAGLGIKQGLAFDRGTDRNNLDLLFAYLFELITAPDAHTNPLLIDQSDDTLRNGGFYSRFLFDLAYNAIHENPISKNVEGVYLEAFAEFSPGFEKIEHSWFRFGSLAQAFLPLFEHKEYGPDSKEQVLNVLSSYLGFQILFDHLLTVSDSSLPYTVYNRTGGRDEREGLGGLVRGLGDGYLGGLSKFAINIDWYLNGPALFGADIVPGILVYFDWGFSTDYFGQIKDALSFGLGLTLNFLDYTHGVIYLHFLPLQAAYDGNYGPLIGFDIGLHF